jgi:hypothetical protein
MMLSLTPNNHNVMHVSNLIALRIFLVFVILILDTYGSCIWVVLLGALLNDESSLIMIN